MSSARFNMQESSRDVARARVRENATSRGLLKPPVFLRSKLAFSSLSLGTICLDMAAKIVFTDASIDSSNDILESTRVPSRSNMMASDSKSPPNSERMKWPSPSEDARDTYSTMGVPPKCFRTDGYSALLYQNLLRVIIILPPSEGKTSTEADILSSSFESKFFQVEGRWKHIISLLRHLR